jgi:hypothetical protein
MFNQHETRSLAGGDDRIARWLATYTPRLAPTESWDPATSEFVASAVTRAAPDDLGLARRYTTVLARLAIWSRTQGLPLSLDVVLDPANVERFVTVELTPAVRATYRSRLRRLGRTVTTAAPWTPPPKPHGRRSVARPYSPAELAALQRDIAAQSTPERRAAATAVLLLGLGAGLDGRWCTKIRGTDVTTEHDVVVVDVPDPDARRVAVWSNHADDLSALATHVGTGLLVGGDAHKSRNWLNDLNARLAFAPGTPPLSPRRLRSTWLTQHLTRGTRLPELARAASLETVTVLSDLLRDIPPLDRHDALVAIRGGGDDDMARSSRRGRADP